MISRLFSDNLPVRASFRKNSARARSGFFSLRKSSFRFPRAGGGHKPCCAQSRPKPRLFVSVRNPHLWLEAILSSICDDERGCPVSPFDEQFHIDHSVSEALQDRGAARI